MIDERIELPWMPIHWERFMKGTQHMDATQIGAYLLLLREQWFKGSVPKNHAKLLNIARLGKGKVAIDDLLLVLEKFKPNAAGDFENDTCRETWNEQYEKYLVNKARGSNGGKKKHENRSRTLLQVEPEVTNNSTDIRSKKEEIPKGIIHQQHTHEEFSQKIFTEAHEQDRVNIELQLEPKRLLHQLEVQQFNAHLHTANKIHETFHEWQKHLRNWLNTKPKLKAKTTNERTINTTDKIGRTTIEATRKFIDENSDENSEFEKRA